MARSGQSTLCHASLALALALVAPEAAAQTRRPATPAVQVSAGGYELSNEDGSRKCLMLLRPGDVPGGHGIGFPAPCRLALPLLASVAAWTLTGTQEPSALRLGLANAAGATLIEFRPGADDTLSGRDATGSLYVLRPTTGQPLTRRIEGLKREPATAPAPPPAAASSATDLGAMRAASGTYQLIRAGNRDTGCRLTLAGDAGAKGTLTLAPGCTDKGVAVFAPAGWTISAGTLWLTGQKGRLSFERNRRGGWDKAPGQGEALVLVRPVNP